MCISQNFALYCIGTIFYTYMSSEMPHLFAQLYTIGTSKSNYFLPLVFALLPNKRQDTYEKLLQALIDVNADLNPATISTDFELAAIKAYRQKFPQVIVHGCYFHLSPNIFKHIQGAGLAVRYGQDAEFALKLKSIAALAFAPTLDVVQVLRDIGGRLPS